MIVDIFLKIAQNVPLSQSEMEELSAYISASHTTTAKITNMREIGELAYDLGEVWAGRFIASADPNNNNVASSTFTGTYMDANGVTGKNNGTVQAQLKSSDGTITAGGGAVVLDESGVLLLQGSSLANILKWSNSSGLYTLEMSSISFLGGSSGQIKSVAPSTGSDTDATLYLLSQSIDTSTSGISISAINSNHNLDRIDLLASSNRASFYGNKFVINDSSGDFDTIIMGDTDANLFVADAGLDAIGIGGAAESGKKLKVTGAARITGAVTMDGDITLGDAAADTLTFNGTPAGQIVSGTYTPTPTKVTNFTTGTVTMRTCQYMRVGSVVTVSGAFNADPDATGLCVFTFTLPIASNFANSYELAGAGATDQTTPVALMIRGSSTADAAVVSWSATTASAQEAYFTLTYRII